MKKYRIENEGCDDTTYSEMELTEQELELLIKFAKENNKNSHCGCQPRIYISEVIEKEETIVNKEYKPILKEEN